jgi:hypothetical protein
VLIDSVVCWKWSKPGYRSKFTAHHVNTLRRMVERHYPHPHRFICITDDADGLDPQVEAVPIWDEWANIPNPTWPGQGPSCYRRLRAFSPEFESIAGKRFVSIDLDVVIVGDLSPLWVRDEDFLIWDPLMTGYRYNGSMWLMTTGSRPQVYQTFDPLRSPKLSNANKHFGSDQAWVQYVLGPDEQVWNAHDGVLGYKRDCVTKNRGRLPAGARIVVFHGKPDPWDLVAHRRSPWIKEHYR